LPARQSNRKAARLPRLKRSPAVIRGLNLLGQQVEPRLSVQAVTKRQLMDLLEPCHCKITLGSGLWDSRSLHMQT